MTKIKFCGLSRAEDIATANEIKADYVGFVFATKSKRYVTPEKARALRQLLDAGIKAVGVFADEKPERAAELLNSGVIDMAQLHGGEDEAYIAQLRSLTDKPVMQAFQITCREGVAKAENSSADLILLDSGAGTGRAFDWELIGQVSRPYFLAGGLDCHNVAFAVRELRPCGVDASSGIERDGIKDKSKMAAFAAAVRKEDEK